MDMRVGNLVGARDASTVRGVTQQSRRRWLAACAALLAMSWASTAGAVCYVNKAATGANTGASWTDAYTDLQSALTNTNCSEVWVAQGPYTPDASNTTVSFNIGRNVALYGGFSGVETSRDARNPVAHVTTLSGVMSGGYSQHIVVMNGTVAGSPITASTTLDGFTLRGGYNTNGGGALWCRGNGAGHECSPTLANLVFLNNHAGNGGAIELDGYSGGASNPTLTNITFSSNSATTFGGAIYCNGQASGGVCSPTLTNVTFSGNTSATYGGAMVNDGSGGGTSSPTLTNVTFSGNSAVNGGAMFNNGGGGTSSPKLVNATFSGNSASYGGAIYNSTSTINGGTSNTLVLNSILWSDSATTSGPEFYSNATGETSLYYSIVQGGCTASCGGTPIYTGDPLLGALADNGGYTQTLMPGVGSAAIDKVPCNYSSEEPVTDQRGAVRPDPASSGPTRCDIGAVEANSLPGDLIFANRFGSSPWDDF